MKTKIITLHVDNVNDDTEAIQAFIDGRIIGHADGRPHDGKTLDPGDYIVIDKS